MNWKTFTFFICAFLWTSLFLSAEPWSSHRLDESLLRGPLKISADSTISKEKGKEILAQGNVFLKYEIETGETLQASAQFLKYEDGKARGELWGSPSAIWTRKFVSPGTSEHSQQTILNAEKIIFRLKESELTALGSVRIFQGSSTLTAGEAHFFDSEKKLVARGGRPTFTNRQAKQVIYISAEEILSFVKQKRVQFQNQVQGKIEFIQ